MKLYVWTGVLCDYTCGMAFAIAESVEDAIQVIATKGLNEGHIKDPMGEYEIEQLRSEQPMVYELSEKIGYYIWGGS